MNDTLTRRSTPLFLILFFLSGSSALIYEVVWTRLFTVVIGNTVFSVSAILTVFMAGLALGSRLAGRIIDTRLVPLIRTYAGLEAGIGLYNLALPLLLKAVDPLFGFLYANGYQSSAALAIGRLVIAFLLLIVPATLMGATLPVLVRFYVENIANVGAQAGRVYSANTFGAAVGTAAAGFVLVPFLGVRFALTFAVTLNFGIALAAWLLSGKYDTLSLSRSGGGEPTLNVDEGVRGSRIVLVAMSLSGIAALINEVAWTRVLVLVIGPTTYAFTLMLCSMITGLGLGAAIGSHVTRRYAVRPSTFAWVQVAISLASLALIPAFGRLPLWIAPLVLRYIESFATRQIVEFLLIFGLLVVPTTFLGMTFPIASKLYAKSDSLLGTAVSAVYAFNTVGGIVGALVAGFVLIPSIGSQYTLIVAAFVSAVAGLSMTVVTAVYDRRRWTPVLGALLAFCSAFLIPKWNPELMASGAYKYAPYITRLDMESVLTSGDLLYFKEGAATTVSVKKYRGNVILSVDGKVDATDAADMLTQKMLGHLPLLVSDKPATVAIIGLGSGVTAGAVLKHPIEKLDVVEISREVVEASRLFSHVNHEALMDPRTELVIGDGRNHLRYVRRNYDVIISEPSNPWMSGMASLFTQEFFKEARSRLGPAGVFCQWLHSYNMSIQDLRTIVRTFRLEFPHATLWTLTENDFLLLGSASAVNIDEALLKRHFERVAEDLREVKVQDLYSIVTMLMLRDEELDRFSEGAISNTDDLPILEFSAPHFIYANTSDENFAVLSAGRRVADDNGLAENHRNKGEMYLAAEAFKEAREEFVRAISRDVHDARAWKGLVETARGGFDRPGLKSFLEAALQAETNTVVRLAAADFFAQEPGNPRTVEALDAILEEEPGNIEALEKMADALGRQGSPRLLDIAERLLALAPQNVNGLYHLATFRIYQGRLDEAIQLTKNALELDPQDIRARNLLAISYGQTFQTELAETEFQRATTQAPEDSTSFNNYGIFLLERNRTAEARHQFERAVSINPEDVQGFVGIGETFRQEGNLRRARTWYRKALQLDPNHPVARQHISE